MNIPMAASIFVGAAVTAHNNTLTNASKFDSLSVISPLPMAPGNLTATLQNAEASLSWSPSPNAISYNIKRAATNNGVYATIASSLVATNYTDSPTPDGTVYYYVVTAVNANGESANSNPASLLVTLPRLSAGFSENNLALSWLISAPAFSLYSASNLLPSVIWLPVTNSVVTNDGNLVVNLKPGNGSQFYRLRMP